MPRLRRLKEQVVVITGASSGIGLSTARMAAERGARVVLTSFDERPLQEATESIRRAGGEAISVTADVAEPGALEEVARRAVERYGRIDTWVNNAGVHLFGRLDEVALEDERRLFEVNYWGAVYGTRAAIPRLIEAGGGALIVVGSVLSSRSVPLQGTYTASKHALKAWVESLRTELQDQRAPVSVSFIKPAAMHTPIARHSRSILEGRAQLPPPMYHPRVTARAILFCAEHPRRDMIAGGSGLLAEFGEKFAPKIADVAMRVAFFRLQEGRGEPRGEDALYRPLGRPARELGEDHRVVLRRSPWTAAVRHRALALGLVGGAALVLRRWFR